MACPGFDPAQFWRLTVGVAAWRSMVDKYEALARAAELAAGPRGDDYKRTLVELSSRWPGALREGELIGPSQVEARREAAVCGVIEPTRPRGAWTDSTARAVICWTELHELIADVLAFRRTHPRSSTEQFADALAAPPSAAHERRWPEPARLPATVGPVLRIRSAYLWLAARSGSSLPELNALLFGRSGHWDQRSDDPHWAK